MKIASSSDVDISTIRLREGRPVDSRDPAEGVIVHLAAKGLPLEIEVLDASRVVQKKDVEVSMAASLPRCGQAVSSFSPVSTWPTKSGAPRRRCAKERAPWLRTVGRRPAAVEQHRLFREAGAAGGQNAA